MLIQDHKKEEKMEKKTWWYYLHTNGDLIGKHPVVVEADPEYFDSPFVKKTWHIILDDRGDAWRLVLEALVLGARIDRVKELADKWKLTKEDAMEMIFRLDPDDDLKKGFSIFCEKILKIDEDKFWDEVFERSGDPK